MHKYSYFVVRIVLALGILMPCSFGYSQTLRPDSIWNSMNVVWDTNTVVPEPTNSEPGGVAIGRYFKGLNDDTIRIVSTFTDWSWPYTVYLVIATDTATMSFGANKFRIEQPCSTGPVTYVTKSPVALGNIDGDDFTDIIFAHRDGKLLWVEWDTTSDNWQARDSIVRASSIMDVAIGDANNDGNANEIVFAPRQYCIVHALWTGTGWDTTTIMLAGDVATWGVAIGDVRPDFSGNEIYICGYNVSTPFGERLWMVRWNGVDWVSEEVNPQYAGDGPKDIVVGDIDPTRQGNEIAMLYGGPNIAVFSWEEMSWIGRLWYLHSDPGGALCDLALGDVLVNNPGDEIVVTRSAFSPFVFWLAPNGSAWAKSIPLDCYSEHITVGIGDVNRFRNACEEIIVNERTTLLEVEAHDFVDDIGTYYYHMYNPTSIINAQDTVVAVVYNAGSTTQSGFNVGYALKNSPLTGSLPYTADLLPSDTGVLRLPVVFDFLGMDTLFVFTNLPGDAYTTNDTIPLHIEVFSESTKVASGFNPRIFPPVNGTTPPYDWASLQIRGETWINWFRDNVPEYPPGPPLEGYAGARFPGYTAIRYLSARLRTHKFNTGDEPCSLFVRFYSWHDNWTSPKDPETLIIEYSLDDIDYTSAWRFVYPDSQPYYPNWYAWDVELGNFSSKTDMYVGVRATSGGGGTDFFIDSVCVYGVAKTGIEEKTEYNIPDHAFLKQISSNPSASMIHFGYGVPYQMKVTIAVYNILGQLIKTIKDDVHDAGCYNVVWDGTDATGKLVSAGTYFVHMTTPVSTIARKIVILK